MNTVLLFKKNALNSFLSRTAIYRYWSFWTGSAKIPRKFALLPFSSKFEEQEADMISQLQSDFEPRHLNVPYITNFSKRDTCLFKNSIIAAEVE